MLGPTAADSAPASLTVPCRRYLCLPCGAVVLVVPRAMLRRRWYSASAIALAFAPGRVVEVDQDQDFLTGLRYDVTILHDNGTSTDVEVDAESGRIVSTDFDNDWD
jgi:hypothetical protein